MRSPCFINGWLDAAAVGGLSIVAYPLVRLAFGSAALPAADNAAALLLFVVNYPHFSATIYRLYQRPQNVHQFPVTALVVPVLLLGAVGASAWQPHLVAPSVLVLYLVWSPYHYSGQTIGITLLYARRSGCEVSPMQRAALTAFVYSTFLASFAYPRPGGQSLFGVTIPDMHLPGWLGPLLLGLEAASAGAFLFLIFARGTGRVLPPIALVPMLAQFVWFLPGQRTYAFYAFIPLFHSLQYLYVAWAVQMGVRRGVAGAAPRSLLLETVRWGSRNVAGGMLLFIALPWFLYGLCGVPLGVVIAAVNIHHFFVDGVIWKLRQAGADSPLLIRIADLVAPRRALALAA